MAAVASLAIFVTAIYSYNVSIGTSEAILKKIKLQSNIYVMSNALKYGKLYSEEALRLSVCQSLYDYGSEEKYWYRNNDTSPSESEFISLVEDKTKINMNNYPKEITFLNSKFKPKLPEYDIKGNLIEDIFSVNALSDSNIVIEKKLPKDNIILRRKGDIKYEIKYDLFSNAKETINKTKKLHEDIEDYIFSFNVNGSAGLAGCDNKGTLTDLEVFNKVNNLHLGNWNDSKLEDKIENMINNSFVNLSYIINTNNLTIEPNCTENIKDNCGSGGSYLYTKTCEFSYDYDLDISFILEGELCPILDEKILIKPLPLNFSISINTKH